MPIIPRQVKPPARLPLTCKVPEETATLLKLYAEFLDSTQEYVVVETLRLAFRKDKEFHGWLATTPSELHGETSVRTTNGRSTLDCKSSTIHSVSYSRLFWTIEGMPYSESLGPVPKLAEYFSSQLRSSGSRKILT